MSEHILVSLASIIVLGTVAQWIAWRFHFPSIMLLLVIGLISGPITGLIDPDHLFGNLLLPLVSMSVAIILFEGGLSLRISELPVIRNVLFNLMSLGIVITWLLSAVAAYFIIGLDLALAVLLGAILVVTGPTVIGPLLLHIRPLGQVSSILRWEGILIDPIGGMLAVLVFEAILTGGFQGASSLLVKGILKTLLIGGLIGVVSAGALISLFKRYWVPDFLQNGVTLMAVIGAYTASNFFQTESGLLAATVLGVALANQKSVSIKHIIEFKENLRILLISSLFILLAARLEVSTITHIGLSTFVFLGALILIIRPLAVYVSTLGSNLNWRERAFLAWMAPRGIVAAAISSVFALRLAEAGYAQADIVVSLTFMVIIVTVTVYSLTTTPLARWLKVAQPNPQGVLIVGAHSWAREIAKTLQGEGFQVLLVDTNRANIAKARLAGLPIYQGNILSEHILDEVKLDGIGRLLAMTSNEEINSLASLKFAEVFSRSEVYQLNPEVDSHLTKETVSKHLHGRFIFGPGITYTYLAKQFSSGAVIKKTNLTDKFDFKAFKKRYGEKATPLFVTNGDDNLMVYATDNPPMIQPGHILISLVNTNSEKSP